MKFEQTRLVLFNQILSHCIVSDKFTGFTPVRSSRLKLNNSLDIGGATNVNIWASPYLSQTERILSSLLWVNRVGSKTETSSQKKPYPQI